MTQQTNGMPDLKYSEEIFRDIYEALKECIAELEQAKGISQIWLNKWRQALAKAEGKE